MNDSAEFHEIRYIYRCAASNSKEKEWLITRHVSPKSSNRSKQECFMESLKSFPNDQVALFQEEGATL